MAQNAKLTLLVARHGNTFDSGDTLLRVGQRTDLPLSKSGREQAKELGEFLMVNYPNIDRVIVSSLKRTQQTAQLALPHVAVEINPMFDEIDYGIDEGQPESSVIARVGAKALQQWEEEAIPVAGWLVDPEKIINNWKKFADSYVQESEGDRVILVITSNGIARFLPHITRDFSVMQRAYSLKLKTGAISAFQYKDSAWQVNYWNYRVNDHFFDIADKN